MSIHFLGISASDVLLSSNMPTNDINTDSTAFPESTTTNGIGQLNTPTGDMNT